MEIENVSRETLAQLEAYFGLLKKWNPTINLVARSTLEDSWERHFVDSAQIFDLAPKEGKKWVDIGSGGGFPGLVCAVISKNGSDQRRFTLIEADQRKSSFLRTVSRELSLGANVVSERIEKAPLQDADILSARALASLEKLLEFAELHLNPRGTALFLKGANYREEIEKALERWTFSYKVTKSKTNQDAVILKIGDIKRV